MKRIVYAILMIGASIALLMYVTAVAPIVLTDADWSATLAGFFKVAVAVILMFSIIGFGFGVVSPKSSLMEQVCDGLNTIDD